MGTVAEETTIIRELLEAKLAEILAAIGGGAPVPVTADEIIAALAGTLAALGLRGNAATAGRAAGLYVPSLPGDTDPAVYIGSLDAGGPGLRVESAEQGVSIETTSSGSAALTAFANGGSAVVAQTASNTELAVSAYNTGQGRAIAARSEGPTGLSVDGKGTTAAYIPVLKATRLDNSSAVGTGIAAEYYMNGLSPTLAGVHEVYIASAGNANHRFHVRSGANLRQVFIMDRGTGTTNTSIWVEFNGAIVRVKAGASGSGPGGVGRALYID